MNGVADDDGKLLQGVEVPSGVAPAGSLGSGVRCGVAQGVQQQRKRAMQADDDFRIARLFPFGHEAGEHLAEQIAHRPTLQAGDAIARQNRAAVMKLQPRPQRDAPLQAIGAYRRPLRHLRARAHLRIGAE